MDIKSSFTAGSASIYSDLNSLDSIRQLGQSDQKGAIQKAAKEFEAFFLNMLLKSMRQAGEVFGEDNPMSSSQEKMFVSMQDEQLAVDLSQKGLLGIADLMSEQLIKRQGLGEPDKSPDSSPKQLKDLLDSNLLDSNLLENNQPTPPAVNFKVSPVSNPVIPAESKLKDWLLQERVSPKPDPLVEKRLEKETGRRFEPAFQNNTQAAAPELTKPSKRSLFDEAKDFVSTLFPLAQKAAEKLSLDPKVLLAQAALETGWGKYVMHDESGKPGFNLFGVKANSSWQGNSIKIDTLEVENESFKKVNASFRKYQDFAESFEDYVSFVKDNPRYQKAVKAAATPQKYLSELQQAGYATDPNYARKIMNIFNDEIFDNENLNESRLSLPGLGR